MKNTTLILQQLRLLMLNTTLIGDSLNLSAYIVPSSDAHHNIRRADCDQRLAFTSGFDGSSGTGIITAGRALLWTDARYFLQAEQQLDDNWTLMKDGLPETPSQSEWMLTNLPKGSFVGIDPTLYSRREWNELQASLREITLLPVGTNLVDLIWGEDRPQRPVSPVTQLNITFTGVSARDKLAQIRGDLLPFGAEALVITEMDEIAWLLNLRGTDLPHAPTFFAFGILTLDSLHLCIEDSKISEEVRQGFILATNGSVTFHPYAHVLEVLEEFGQTTSGNILFSKNANYALTNAINASRLIMEVTPINLRKAVKNPVEILGMKRALIRDAAILCKFYSWLETAMANGENVTEVSVATGLLGFKRNMTNFVDLSFKTISGSGPNGAIIHYFPTNETDRKLSIDEMYLIDAGSHYLDGTTDVTRTFHFGTPTPFQKDCYTRVFKGQIALARARFPFKTKGHALDSLARQFLWDAGLDYGHGTGHGVGAYLNVGEGPQSINSKFNEDDPGLDENMVTSNEPGYYESGSFGIRLENMLRVRASSNQGFLEFEDMTFVPYQHKLINRDLLTITEIAYLNNYQQKCRDIVGSFILENDLGLDTYNWLIENTLPII